jgi:hypothetical protein
LSVHPEGVVVANERDICTDLLLRKEAIEVIAAEG